ncbi:2-haloacid dehalogenase [Profundibacterium mesophilum KAUST100406-0324]|uniref:2-haloacid dehalogenase n=2 Tax=Profundibacterium TaxID=1258570 RepID=A0A921TCH4_9RHOB|nr:2-haloacid dehalogenase [Profundibacterium mesophilum KAUST100406-0324]
MREDRVTADWPASLGLAIAPEIMARVEAGITAELASLQLRHGMADILTGVGAAGLRTALCSNLASPYGPAVRSVLPGQVDIEAFSYLVGALKPEPAIYTHVAEGLRLSPDRILFVGDSQRADIDGPRSFGFRAMHVLELEAAMCPM